MKLYGFEGTAAAQQLSTILPAHSGSDSLTKELYLVHWAAAQKFVEESAADPQHAMLWLSEAFDEPENESLINRFRTSVWPSDPDLRKTLQRFAQCERSTEWAGKVMDIPSGWFAGLQKDPADLFVGELPFDIEETDHLIDCGACRQEVMERILQRAQTRREGMCPPSVETGRWLRGGTASFIESHLRSCWECRESLQRQASLYVAEGIIDALQWARKSVAAGVSSEVNIVEIPWQRMREFLGVSGSAPKATAQEIFAGFARLLAGAFESLKPQSEFPRTRHQTYRVRGVSSTEIPLTVQAFEQALEQGSVTISTSTAELEFKPNFTELGVVEIRATGVSGPSGRFAVVFVHLDKKKTRFESHNGVVCLSTEVLLELVSSDVEKCSISRI